MGRRKKAIKSLNNRAIPGREGAQDEVTFEKVPFLEVKK
jgi:hypothetical protein